MIKRFDDVRVETLRVARFGLVGVVATAVYVIVTLVAIEAFHISAVASSVLGIGVSICISYLGHAFYTFRVIGDHTSFFSRFIVLASIGFGLSTGLMWLLTDIAKVGHRTTIVVIVLVMPLLNFMCNRFWVFRSGLPAR